MVSQVGWRGIWHSPGSVESCIIRSIHILRLVVWRIGLYRGIILDLFVAVRMDTCCRKILLGGFPTFLSLPGILATESEF